MIGDQPLQYTDTLRIDELRPGLQFVSDSQDCAAIRFDFGPSWEGFEYDSYFVRVADGEYKEIWGMRGIVPFNGKSVTRLF